MRNDAIVAPVDDQSGSDDLRDGGRRILGSEDRKAALGDGVQEVRAMFRVRARRTLKPGGTLVLSTPDIGAITARVMRTRWAFMTPPEHLGFFNASSLSFMLERQLGREFFGYGR